MKRIASILFTCLLLVSCSEDDGDTQIKTTFNFTHNWDGTQVTNADFNTIQYTNANGEELSIEKLRYLISKIKWRHIYS
jgi:PBP1b-binding outer membrane lipoprotein LpoB